MVTYEQLKSGYILKAGDALVLHGIKYDVRALSGVYHLSCSHRKNSHVFDILGMGAEERKTFVKKFNPIYYAEAQGPFPEFNDLKSLTNLVIALYEVPEYKEGDWVTVLSRNESGNHSPVCYADWMTKYERKTFKVRSNYLRSTTNTCNGIDNGDPHVYEFVGPYCYWTSQMIRKATEEEIPKAKGDIKDCDDYPIKEQLMTSGHIGILSEETAQKFISQADDMLKSLQRRYVDFGRIPMYAPLWKGTPSDTEIRLPKNENSTPHIKL